VPQPRTVAAASSFGADNVWYRDFGATDYITGDLDRLTMHDLYAGADQVHAANRTCMDITRIGKTIIPNPCRNLVLNNVLHVPSTQKVLFQFIALIEFHPYSFFIKERKMRKVILHGPCKGGLYPLPPSSSKFRKLVFSAIKIPADRWHSRLGHPACDIIHRVVSTNNLPCGNFDSTSETVCDAYACAKAHQLSYYVSSSRPSAPLELIF
jgi:hypothetical protein